MLNNWVVTQFKSKEKDGYDAVQIGLVRKKYAGKQFSNDWVKKAKCIIFMH